MPYTFRAALILSLLLATSCTTAVQSNPQRTATEELLISTAADRAANQLALQIPKNESAYVDTSSIEGTDSKYAGATIRDSLLKHGVHLVDKKENAQTVIEARSGALSTDQKDTLIGIPGFNIPIPFAAASLPFPKIALYEAADQEGVAQFAIVGYDNKTGGLVASQDPQYGFSHNVKRTVLIFFSWSENDAMPKENKDIVSRSISGFIPGDSSLGQ